jgi:DNA-binding transcriptional regulator YhcF (GntR family)
VLLHFDETDPRPIYSQLVAQAKELVHKGKLHPGDELPSVRDLASSLGINMHTAHRAYQVLRDEGVIVLRPGSPAASGRLAGTAGGPSRGAPAPDRPAARAHH